MNDRAIRCKYNTANVLSHSDLVQDPEYRWTLLVDDDDWIALEGRDRSSKQGSMSRGSQLRPSDHDWRISNAERERERERERESIF